MLTLRWGYEIKRKQYDLIWHRILHICAQFVRHIVVDLQSFIEGRRHLVKVEITSVSNFNSSWKWKIETDGGRLARI